MCDVLIPALIGVGALALLGGGTAGAGCDNCPTGPVCAVTQYGNYTVTIPQLAGEGTNVQQVPVQDQFAYAPPPVPYGGQPVGPAPYAGAAVAPAPAPAPYGGVGHYDPNAAAAYGASAMDQSAVGASGYVDPNGAGVSANVGAFDASIDTGARAY